MISVRGRDGRELEMDEVELEEGEALCYNGDDGIDSAIDPDIALSYIEEKLHSVLGHFEKDFEGGVSAENLGAKYGGYGSFLPTYQRSPSWSHTRSPLEARNSNSPSSPRKTYPEDRRQSSLASSNVSPSSIFHNASRKAVSMGSSLRGNDHLPSRHAEESSSKCGVIEKSMKPSNQKALKFRIKVGSENLSTQKNAEIYSGLGLEVSPSSSLDDSPHTSTEVCGKIFHETEESPISILQIMTSYPGDLLLSPLPESLIHLNENIRLPGKCESKLIGIQKDMEQKILKPCERTDAISTKLSNQKSSNDEDANVSFIKRESDINTLGCEKLVSDTLKLPLLSASQYNYADPGNGTSGLKDGVKRENLSMNENLDNGVAQDSVKAQRLGGRLDSTRKVMESRKVKEVSSIAASTQQVVSKAENSSAFALSGSDVSSRRKAMDSESSAENSKHLVVQERKSANEGGGKRSLAKSLTGVKRKQKTVHSVGAQDLDMPKDQSMALSSATPMRGKKFGDNLLVPKNDSHDRSKSKEKPGDRYKIFFGDLDFEEDDSKSISGDTTSMRKLKDSELVEKRSLSEFHGTSKEKHHAKNSEMPNASEKYPTMTSYSAPVFGNGQSSRAPMTMVPLVNEDWVSCDKCQKWRLLPLGTNPKSLPDKWICRMLTWLPGMNRCSVPEVETTNTLRALYHPAATAVAGPTSEIQQGQVNDSALADARYSDQEPRNSIFQVAPISKKKKHGPTKAANSVDLDGKTHSSDSLKNPASGKNSNLNSKLHPSGPVDEYIIKDKASLVSNSNKGTGIKVSSKREPEMEDSKSYKRIRSTDLHVDDHIWASDNGRSSSEAGRDSTSLSNDVSDRSGDKHKEDWRDSAKKDIFSSNNTERDIPGTENDGLFNSRKSDESDSLKKRKSKQLNGSGLHQEPLSRSAQHIKDSEQRMEKKARVSKSGEKDNTGSKISGGDNRRGMNTTDQPFVAANSSSSKVSESHDKHKTSDQVVKGSPVESVSSSPLREDGGSGQKEVVGKDTINIFYDTHRDNSSQKCHDEEIPNTDYAQNSGSRTKKILGQPSHSKDNACAYGSKLDKDKMKASESSLDSLDDAQVYGEKTKSRRVKLDEHSGTPNKGEKLSSRNDISGGALTKSGEESQKKSGNDGQNKKHYPPADSENNSKLPKRMDLHELCGGEKSSSLPPSGKGPSEHVSRLQPFSGSQSKNGGASDNGNSLKIQMQRKKSENQNGQATSSRHPTPNIQHPSPLRRDSSSHAVNSALKEAKDLKHLADRLKNSGSNESIGIYFQAALKFLHGASLLESGSSEATKHNDLMRSMDIYSSTAKLCEFCAHEYEKSKNMANAALAYKCVELAYMRVVYSSNTSASRDRNELQTALQIIHPGESPSSSASDIDNLNNQASVDKAAVAKVVGSPQVSGSHIITSRDRASILRILNFAKDVNSAMEASSKSRSALATSRLGETHHIEGISSLKKALDFNFQDVESLLHLVRVAMEATAR